MEESLLEGERGEGLYGFLGRPEWKKTFERRIG